jgi:PAS domain S-box-containing protein
MSQAKKKPLILMVDDVPKNLQVLGSILGGNEYLITPAMSGEQALARVEQLMPDLILLDVMMPGIDGFETCRQIKANPKTSDIPIIFLTAKTETIDVVKGFKVGAIDYVTKPFQAEELLTRVETQVSLRKKTLELKALYEELKQNEKKYRGLFVSSIDAILRISVDFHIQDANPGAEMLLGQSLDCLIKKHLTAFLDTTQHQKIQSIINEQVVCNGYSNAFESEVLNKDSKNVPVEVRLWQAEEDVSGLWILFRDISERTAMRKLREDVDRIMRHDLKNPLSGIIGLSDMLKIVNDNLTDDQKNWVKQIHASGMQALDMINHSLDIFKMEQGNYFFNPAPCNLVSIFKKIEADFFQLINSKNLDMTFSMNELPMNDNDIYTILGEKRQLENLFANLVKNAIEASSDNQLISVHMSSKNDTHQIVVANQGVIPEEIQNRFFEKYATCGKKSGTGLGTYSAKLIAETHGGDICFRSNEQEGTQLIVSLPKSNHDIIQHSTAPKNQKARPPKKKFTKQIKILAADDSPNNMLLIGHYLEGFPCLLDLAENGQICVDYFKSTQYDLVLIDLQMPVMDGFEAISQMRDYENEKGLSQVPIIALSADDDKDLEKKCIDIGCNELLLKPFTPKKIQELVIHFCQLDQ